MYQLHFIIALVCLIPACSPSLQHQVHDLNRDGVTLLRRQDYIAAQMRFQKALELDPADPISRYNYASAAHRAGDWALAEQAYRDCLQQLPDHAPSRHGLGLLLLQQDRVADARYLIEGWVSERPDLADTYAELGWLLREVGDLPGAQERLHQALELDSNNARALAELGIIYETYSYPDRAYVLYQRSLKSDPNQAEIVARFSRLRRPGYAPPSIPPLEENPDSLNDPSASSSPSF